MDLKRESNVDELRAGLEREAKACAEVIAKDTKQAIEKLEVHASTLRDLAGLPTGELIQRATVAEVIPVGFRNGQPGELVTLRGMELRLETTGQAGTYYTENVQVQLQRGNTSGPTVKAQRLYRMLLFLVPVEVNPR